MNTQTKVLLSLALVIAAVVVGFRFTKDPASPQTGDSTQVVHLRLQSFALMLHPLKLADVESRQVATPLHAGLIVQDQEGTTRSAVAEKWTQEDGTWEFTLKQDLTFSNGQPLRDEDVVTSLCNAMQPASPWAWALASIEHSTGEGGKTVECSGISIPTQGTIRIVESRSAPWFLDAIGGPAGWVIPATGANEEAYGVVPGLGPYKVKEVVPDTRVVLEPREHGSAIAPGAGGIVFDYYADDAVAASAFTAGRLHVLDLTSPTLAKLLVDPASGKLRTAGSLVERDWDRIRIAIINEKSLIRKGFSPEQATRFVHAYSATVGRDRLVENASGIATVLYTGFPSGPNELPGTDRSVDGFPAAKLTVLTEPDAYSDLIAASLPKSVGAVSIDYRGVDKGVLIQSLVAGEFDIASILIEATTHSPVFWKSFFTPGNPFTAFGKPIAGLESIDVSDDEGVQEAARLIAQYGNWVGLLQERRIQAVAPGIGGISYSPSGQTNFAFIRRQ